MKDKPDVAQFLISNGASLLTKDEVILSVRNPKTDFDRCTELCSPE
jgi:hypothetical protein